MIRLILSIILFFLLTAQSLAGVNASHPRIWIDGPDGDILTRLKSAEDANSTEWAALKSWCDTYVGQNLTGGQYGEWQKAMMNYALAYQVTGSQTYGNEGVKYLIAMLRDKNSIGDGLGGATNIQTDSGWVARTIGVSVGIGRDWLDGASDLTSSVIDECAARLDDWITWYGTSGYGRAIPLDNYHAGYFAMVYCAAIGLSGDADYQSSWMTLAESLWTDSVLPTINGLLAGGDWYEGWNYGNQAARLYISYPHALQTGTTNDNHWDETTWAAELIKSHIHMLYPSRGFLSDDGSWSGDNKGNPLRSLMMLLSTLGGNGGVTTTLAGTAKWFADNITWEPIAPDKWEVFLWTDSSVSEVLPTATNMGGLTYSMTGGHAIARGATWSDTNATIVDVVARGDGSSQAEGTMNSGELKIGSRGQSLLMDGRTYEQSSEYANVPKITGSHTYAPYQEWWHDDVALIAEDNTDSVYCMATRLDQAYDGNLNDSPSATYYTRHILFVRPDYVVVFDNLRTTAYPTNSATYQWYMPGTPSISSGIVTATSGSARLFMTPLDTGATITSNANTGSRTGVRRVDVALGTTTVDHRLVTVFETAASTKSSMDTVTKLTADHLTGALISGASQDIVVLFNSHDDGSAITLPVSYTASPSQGSEHYVTGLPASTSVSVSGGAETISGTTSAKGVLQFSDTGTGERTYTISEAATSTGSLTVTLSPAGAITAGAQWAVDGGNWQDSGTTVTGLSAGSHTITYKTTTGYTSPESASATVVAGETATASGTYVLTTPAASFSGIGFESGLVN